MGVLVPYREILLGHRPCLMSAGDDSMNRFALFNF